MTKLSLAIELVDRSYVLDNSRHSRRLLLIGHRDETKFLARNLPRGSVRALPGRVP